MEKRYTQPALLWALAQEYAAKKWPEREIGPTDLQLYYYPAAGSGAWLQHGPKLYWQETVNGDHFNNCEQDALAENEIGEVVLMHRGRRQTVVLGHTLAEAVNNLRGNKTGRPPRADEPLSENLTIRLTPSMRAALGDDAGEFVRQAIAEKLESVK
jgi:hypothetical protein